MQGVSACVSSTEGEFLRGKRLEAKGWGREGLLLEWGVQEGQLDAGRPEAVAGRGDDVQANLEGALHEDGGTGVPGWGSLSQTDLPLPARPSLPLPI